MYALPVGELRKELIVCLRQGKRTRRPRAGAVDRRNQMPDMVSIHVRPPEIEDRLMPEHWAGYLIKGKAYASSVCTLVERTSGYVMLIETATSAVEGFSAAHNRMPLPVRESMTCDQGRGTEVFGQLDRERPYTARTRRNETFCPRGGYMACA